MGKRICAAAAMILMLSAVLSLGAAAKGGVPLENGTPKIWARLVSELKTAETGEELHANIGNVSFIPLEVLDTLGETKGVSLKLRLGDASIMTISSETAPKAEKGQKDWQVETLKELFPPKSTLKAWKVQL